MSKKKATTKKNPTASTVEAKVARATRRAKGTKDEPAAAPATTTDDARTLHDIADGYVQHLESAGKSLATVLSYRMDLNVAIAELGADARADSIDDARFAAFAACDRVTKTRGGELKADVSVKKTCRVLRQALAWAREGVAASPAAS